MLDNEKNGGFDPKGYDGEGAQDITDLLKEKIGEREQEPIIRSAEPQRRIGRLDHVELSQIADQSEPNPMNQPFYNCLELVNLAEEDIPMLWDPFIPKGQLTALVGSSASGKSSLFRQLALAISMGENTFLGKPLNTEHGRVLLVSTEDGIQATGSHFITMTNALEGKKRDFLENIIVRFYNTNSYLQDIEEHLEEHGPFDLVLLDAHSDIMEGDIIDNSATRKHLDRLNTLATIHNTPILTLHHLRKEYVATSKDSVAGAHSFEAKSRWVGLLQNRGNGRFKLKTLKANFLTPEQQNEELNLSMDPETRMFTYLESGASVQQSQGTRRRSKFSAKEKGEILARVRSYREEKLSYAKIEKTIRDDGIDIGHSTLQKWIKEDESD